MLTPEGRSEGWGGLGRLQSHKAQVLGHGRGAVNGCPCCKCYCCKR